PEHAEPERIAAEEEAGCRVPEPPRREPRPERGGDEVERRLVAPEGARGGGIVLVEVPERPDPAAEGREPVRRRGRAGPAARRGARRAAGELGGHAGAGADARLDVPLGPQPVEGGDHRPAGEPVLAREVAGGREPGAGGEAAVEDP